jgi:hypothetical protein
MVVPQQAAEALTAFDRAALPIDLGAGLQQSVPHALMVSLMVVVRPPRRHAPVLRAGSARK